MPGKRSDPKKLAAEQKAIRQSVAQLERKERVKRSQAKAVASAKAFKATGEGTMGEALRYVMGEKIAKRRRKAAGYGPEPQIEGAWQYGFKDPEDTA